MYLYRCICNIYTYIHTLINLKKRGTASTVVNCLLSYVYFEFIVVLLYVLAGFSDGRRKIKVTVVRK